MESFSLAYQVVLCTLKQYRTWKHQKVFQALERFIVRQGNIRLIRCDYGTNFVGTKTELQRSLSEMDKDKISHFLQNSGTNWDRKTQKNNSPSGSHTGGVCEHQIKSTCVILSALLKKHSISLNDKSLITEKLNQL